MVRSAFVYTCMCMRVQICNYVCKWAWMHVHVYALHCTDCICCCIVLHCTVLRVDMEFRGDRSGLCKPETRVEPIDALVRKFSRMVTVADIQLPSSRPTPKALSNSLNPRFRIP